MVVKTETFDKDQILNAIESFLKYGEDSVMIAHKGYFCGNGWAATCLRFHLKQLNEK